MNIAHIFEAYYDGEKNFFTIKVYGYAKKHLIGDNWLLFEKSENNVLFDNITYGISVLIFNERNHKTQKVDLSKLFSTKKEVEEYINSIDLDKALELNTCGELKIIN